MKGKIEMVSAAWSGPPIFVIIPCRIDMLMQA